MRGKETALNSSRHKTLQQIFENPVRSDVIWTDIENLISALGGKISRGKGSRVRFLLNDVVAIFHRPHPQKETDKGALKSVRTFLIRAKVEPGNQP